MAAKTWEKCSPGSPRMRCHLKSASFDGLRTVWSQILIFWFIVSLSNCWPVVIRGHWKVSYYRSAGYLFALGYSYFFCQVMTSLWRKTVRPTGRTLPLFSFPSSNRHHWRTFERGEKKKETTEYLAQFKYYHSLQHNLVDKPIRRPFASFLYICAVGYSCHIKFVWL